ncbi:hypothetical protein C8R44DRAFT_869289 [Mycena epipterygia]|nr:hypothetical protein C8R44DRAFT_869289 [Mycena epipterygia]
MDDRLLVYAIAFWDPRDIARSAAVSSTMYGIIQHHRHLVWDPDTHFQPWFRAPAETFRGMLRICGAIVTGSQILQFFNRTSYPDSDMDIFMRVGGLWYMGGWLRSQGYTFAAVSSDYRLFRRQVMRLCSRMMTDHPAHNPAIRGVYNFHRYVASQTVVHLQKIQLIAVDMDPVHHVIFDFHSTAVMNYMTSDTVISVFPLSTFVFQKSMESEIPGPGIQHNSEAISRSTQRPKTGEAIGGRSPLLEDKTQCSAKRNRPNTGKRVRSGIH